MIPCAASVVAMVGDSGMTSDGVSVRSLQLMVALYGLGFIAGIPLLLRFLVQRGARHLFDRYRLSWLKTRPWDLRDVLFIFALLFTMTFLFWGLYHKLVAADSDGEAGVQMLVIFQSILFHWMGLLLVVFQGRGRGYRLFESFGLGRGKKEHPFKLGAMILIGSLPVVITAHLLFALVLLRFGFELESQELVQIIAEAGGLGIRVYLFLLGVVVAPVIEEVLFRGLLLPALAKWISPAPAIVLSSLLFAAFHAHLASFMALFVLSMALSIAYAHTRNLAVPIVMHALFNAIPVTILMLV